MHDSDSSSVYVFDPVFPGDGSDGSSGGWFLPVFPSTSVDLEDDQTSTDSLPLPAPEPGEPVESVAEPEIEVYALSPIVDSTGLKGELLELLGPYDNIVTQYRYQQSGNSYYTYVNEVTPDYPWIFSAILFIVLVHGVFKLLQRCFS